jgi:hypothetical protein
MGAFSYMEGEGWEALHHLDHFEHRRVEEGRERAVQAQHRQGRVPHLGREQRHAQTIREKGNRK